MKKVLAALFIIMGLMILAVMAFFAIEPEMTSLPVLLTFLALFVIDAICYFVAAWGVSKNIKRLYWPTIAVLGINILALVFDNIGIVDISVALYNILLLILFIINMRRKNE